MKAGIHPEYVACKVTCGCGNTFETRCTIPDMHVDICSACHPFYTGRQKFVDTAGRIEKFNKKFKGFDSSMGKDGKDGKDGESGDGGENGENGESDDS